MKTRRSDLRLEQHASVNGFPSQAGQPTGVSKSIAWPASMARAVLLLLLMLGHVSGQTCFDYVDFETAKVPIMCVQKGTLLPPCDPPDDCTSLPGGGPQTVLRMHELWHECFGNALFEFPLGQHPGRGQRWYAFHRQFETDFNVWREAHLLGKIQQENWCQGMALTIGHEGAAPGGVGHVSGCGDGNERPYGTICDNCEALPPCLFYGGAAPDCGGEMGNEAWCVLDGITYTALEEFPNVDKVSEVLDSYFHGAMHNAVGLADGGDYVGDVFSSTCSPRDPMFWRLHKYLDDVVRAWQDHMAVDIMLVIDKSGSMGALDSGGMTKLNAAVQAARFFADILDRARGDGQVNRIGIVTFSTTATVSLGLTDADEMLLNAGGPLDMALDDIATAGPGGATSIGDGLQKALDELCGGDCDGFVAPPGENSRKAILLLTDGMENVEPCLGTGGACSGDAFDYDKLAFVQICSVGFGDAGSLDGDLLTLLSERQGGIYAQNPAADPEDDLKKFFAVAYGQLTDEFLLEDPHGFLPANVLASEPVNYTVCSETKVTFASGWKTPITPGSLRLLVTTPAGNLVRPGAGIQSSVQDAWDYKRIRLPYRGESVGTWRAHLVRPHRAFVNGFTTDSFMNTGEGVTLVRRQIQRLLPNGAARVLYFEDGRRGPDSVYQRALQAEVNSGLIPSFTTAAGPTNFSQRLDENWDLIVYAHQVRGEVSEVYDSLLAGKLCQGQRAIITENRRDLGMNILRCAGALPQGGINWSNLIGDGRLFEGTLRLRNAGYPTFSWGLRTTSSSSVVQGIGAPGTNGAVIACALGQGVDEYWFVGVLGRGLSKLDPHLEFSVRKTGDDLIATARMLPSYWRAGGYDSINARVEVTYPTDGLGNLFARTLREPMQLNGEMLSRRAATLTGPNALKIPRSVMTFPLYDDGSHGDAIPNNKYWTAVLQGLGRYDGMYQFRYIFDFTVAGCTTRREMMQSLFVDSKVNPATTTSTVTTNRVLPDGRRLTTVRITARDIFGNLWGPGRRGTIQCDDPKDCTLGQSIVDNGDGSYTVSIFTPPGVGAVRLDAFNGAVDLPITCTNCPSLALVRLNPTRIESYAPVTATIVLTGPALPGGGGGARVYLSSSDPETARVPESVLVPPGANTVSLVISNAHSHVTNQVTITARYGDDVRENRFTVVPRSAPPVPFEIASISEAGTLLHIEFVSPYRLDRHHLDMRSNLQPNVGWADQQGALSVTGSNTYRFTVPRPTGREKFFRVRAEFESHDRARSTAARVWDGPNNDLLERAARTVEHRQESRLPIPDNRADGIRARLQVPDDLDLTDLKVYLDVRHSHVGDLVVELISPEGKKVTLRARNGASEPDLAGWYGVDKRLTTAAPLTQFIGERAKGEWTMQVSDHGPGDVGQLHEWAVRLTGYERASLVSQR